MKTVRNIAFVTLMAVTAHQAVLLATPVFYGCPDGCTCTVDPNNWASVGIDCPDAAPADICGIVDESLGDYCFFDVPNYIWLYHSQSVTCDYGALSGCQPAALEPPASLAGSCFCWY